MTSAALASWCLKNLDTDTWLSQLTLQRRLAGIRGHRFSAAGLLGAMKRANWLEEHPTMPGIYCLNSRCWLPRNEEQATGANGGLPFSTQKNN